MATSISGETRAGLARPSPRNFLDLLLGPMGWCVGMALMDGMYRLMATGVDWVRVDPLGADERGALRWSFRVKWPDGPGCRIHHVHMGEMCEALLDRMARGALEYRKSWWGYGVSRAVMARWVYY